MNSAGISVGNLLRVVVVQRGPDLGVEVDAVAPAGQGSHHAGGIVDHERGAAGIGREAARAPRTAIQGRVVLAVLRRAVTDGATARFRAVGPDDPGMVGRIQLEHRTPGKAVLLVDRGGGEARAVEDAVANAELAPVRDPGEVVGPDLERDRALRAGIGNLVAVRCRARDGLEPGRGIVVEDRGVDRAAPDDERLQAVVRGADLDRGRPGAAGRLLRSDQDSGEARVPAATVTELLVGEVGGAAIDRDLGARVGLARRRGEGRAGPRPARAGQEVHELLAALGNDVDPPARVDDGLGPAAGCRAGHQCRSRPARGEGRQLRSRRRRRRARWLRRRFGCSRSRWSRGRRGGRLGWNGRRRRW